MASLPCLKMFFFEIRNIDDDVHVVFFNKFVFIIIRTYTVNSFSLLPTLFRRENICLKPSNQYDDTRRAEMKIKLK